MGMCACDIVICQNCYNNNNNKRSRRNQNVNAQKQHDMFYPSSNKLTGEELCIESQVEYPQLQNLKNSDSAHKRILPWTNKNGKNCLGNSNKIC